MIRKEHQIPVKGVTLPGDLHLPDDPLGLVIFSHGSGSSRLSPRNRYVAGELHTHRIGTLLFDLLTPDEDKFRVNRFDIQLLTLRLVDVTRWVRHQPETRELPIGFFGASTGAASALKAAAQLGNSVIKAVVSRGGRPDLTGNQLERVKSPTLLLVGEHDTDVIKLNERVFKWLTCEKKLTIIAGATHLFEEPGTLEQVTRHAADWFSTHLYLAHQNIEKDFMR